ncbi:hypothetical protein AOLI_G00215520 [Acnodon oligacanthus]
MKLSFPRFEEENRALTLLGCLVSVLVPHKNKNLNSTSTSTAAQRARASTQATYTQACTENGGRRGEVERELRQKSTTTRWEGEDKATRLLHPLFSSNVDLSPTRAASSICYDAPPRGPPTEPNNQSAAVGDLGDSHIGPIVGNYATPTCRKHPASPRRLSQSQRSSQPLCRLQLPSYSDHS